MKTLVIGLGNTILTDDGVGIYVVREVARALPASSSIDLVELSVGGVALMEEMVGYERCILVDAMWAPEDEIGQVRVFDAGELPDTLNTASTHDADLPTALKLGRTLGAPLPADAHIQIVAVGAREVLSFGESPTPAVAAAIPEAADRVLEILAVISDGRLNSKSFG
jgi:hydrogenase maturation protease